MQEGLVEPSMAKNVFAAALYGIGQKKQLLSFLGNFADAAIAGGLLEVQGVEKSVS